MTRLLCLISGVLVYLTGRLRDGFQVSANAVNGDLIVTVKPINMLKKDASVRRAQEGEPTVKKLRIILNTALLILALGTLASQFAQDAPTGPKKPNLERRSSMVGLVRTINTAEVVEQSTYGSFASWQTLLAHQQEYLNEWLANFYSRDPNVHFGSTAEILPGWNLRLIVPTDGQGWIVLLKDAKDETGYAVLSDESGVIRECKPLQ